MIALGARCDCGWGPQDYVDLAKADVWLVNMSLMIREHKTSCSKDPRVQRAEAANADP